VKRSLLFVLLIVVALLSTAATRIIPAGGGVCTTQYIHGNIADTSITVTSTNQVEANFCPLSPVNMLDAFNSDGKQCHLALGEKVTIKDIWYTVDTAMGTSEQCKVGLTVDFTGSEPFDFESWATEDFGDGVTPLGNCDELDDINTDGFIDDAGDSCHVSDPVGTVITRASGAQRAGYKLLIDEADTGTPTCSALSSLSYTIKLEICEVSF